MYNPLNPIYIKSLGCMYYLSNELLRRVSVRPRRQIRSSRPPQRPPRPDPVPLLSCMPYVRRWAPPVRARGWARGAAARFFLGSPSVLRPRPVTAALPRPPFALRVAAKLRRILSRMSLLQRPIRGELQACLALLLLRRWGAFPASPAAGVAPARLLPPSACGLPRLPQG